MTTAPNIVLLMTDEQRYDTIAAAGYGHMITPNLDRLVREGCVYTCAHTPNPVCVPARQNVLTGLPARWHSYASNAASPSDSGLPTIPRILADNGYDTRAVGKMHFHPPRRHHGFNRMELMEELPRYRDDDEYMLYLRDQGLGNIVNVHGIRNMLYLQPQRSQMPEEHHGSTWVGRQAARYIRETAGRRPFFLWASWIAPHPPFAVPERYANLYDGASLPLPIPAGEWEREETGEWQTANLPSGREDEVLRRIRELYYASTTLVDRNIGTVLDALAESGVIDNTLIMFTSDHGEMLGDHRRFLKSVPYESSVRIPLVIRYPHRLAPGSRSDAFVDLNDILPTRLDAAGLEYPGPRDDSLRPASVSDLPGASLLSPLSGAGARDREVQYVEHGEGSKRWVSLRDERYKYVYWYGGAREQLFDLQRDPTEQIDLLYGHTGADGFVEHPAPQPPPRPVRNGQFHRFQASLSEDERHRLNPLEDEVARAISDEPVVHLRELDLDRWTENGAPADLVDRIQRGDAG